MKGRVGGLSTERWKSRASHNQKEKSLRKSRGKHQRKARRGNRGNNWHAWRGFRGGTTETSWNYCGNRSKKREGKGKRQRKSREEKKIAGRTGRLRKKKTDFSG